MDHFSLHKSCDTKFQNLVSFKLLLYRTILKQNPVSRKVTLLCNLVTADSFCYVLNRDQIDQRIASNESLTVVVISLYNINYNRMRLKQGEKLH